MIVLRRLALLLLSGLLLLPAAGCGKQPDHFARALAIERELHRQSPDAGVDHARYVNVLRELREIPRGHRDRAKADLMEQRIRDGRRIAAGQKYPQLGDLPPRLAKGAQPASAAPPEGALTTAADTGTEALDIVLYSTSWCGYCRKARAWLTANGIPYVEKDIEKDRVAHSEYQRLGKGYSGVPLLSVNGAVIRGFDARAVQREVDRVRKGATNPG